MVLRRSPRRPSTAAAVALSSAKVVDTQPPNKRKTREKKLEDHIKSLYLKPGSPLAFRSSKTLRDHLNSLVKNKKKRRNTWKKIYDWLLKKDVYTAFRPARKTFPTDHYVNIFRNWQHSQIDLLDVSQWAKANDGVKYLICIIDAFSKKVLARGITNKRAETTAKVMSDFVKAISPQKIQTLSADMGKEWDGAFQKVLKENKIHFYHAVSSRHKAVFIERFFLTLRKLINQYRYENHTDRFIDKLPALISSYNNAKHSSTGFAPNQVTRDKYFMIWKKKYMRVANNAPPLRPPKFKIGQKVRISKLKGGFEKGSERPFTNAIFTIVDVILRRPSNVYLYTLKDAEGNILQGRFYAQEMSPVLVTANTQYRIREILRYKTVGGKRFALVWWQGYPKSSSTWEPLSKNE